MNLLSDLHEWLFPPACAVCAAALPSSTPSQIKAGSSETPSLSISEFDPKTKQSPSVLYHRSFCTDCQNSMLPVTDHYCQRCGAAVGQYVSTKKDCIHCRSDHWDIERIWSIGNYERNLVSAILQSKTGRLPVLRGLSHLVWKLHQSEIRAWQPDLILPIPVHWWNRLRQKTMTTEEFAWVISRLSETPVSYRTLHKIRRTRPQHLLSGKERRSNVKGVHSCRKPSSVAGKRILLIDDVLTTGSTAIDCCKVLKQAGAGSIAMVVWGRGIGQQHTHSTKDSLVLEHSPF